MTRQRSHSMVDAALYVKMPEYLVSCTKMSRPVICPPSWVKRPCSPVRAKRSASICPWSERSAWLVPPSMLRLLILVLCQGVFDLSFVKRNFPGGQLWFFRFLAHIFLLKLIFEIRVFFWARVQTIENATYFIFQIKLINLLYWFHIINFFRINWIFHLGWKSCLLP